jgi:hypothetical protein
MDSAKDSGLKASEQNSARTPVRKLGIRWTIGNVSREGFEALRLSVLGAWKIFGKLADYVVCVNSLSVSSAQRKAGNLPSDIAWHAVSQADLPNLFHGYLDEEMAEGVAWKFAPLRMFPDRFELSLDNDCIVWSLPDALETWFTSETPGLCLIAEDAKSCFGHYAPFCGAQPRNVGIRGLPPQFDLASALEALLNEVPVRLDSELDEQGLQVAALSLGVKPLAVSLEDLTICSPFPPHLPHLGRCGAHFVGLNAQRLPWTLDGREASEITRENWLRLRNEVARRVALCSP